MEQVIQVTGLCVVGALLALVVQVGGNLCRDAGESALASVVETAGTLCALLAALPLLRAVLDMLLELMG